MSVRGTIRDALEKPDGDANGVGRGELAQAVIGAQQAELQAIYAHDTALNEGTSQWMKNLRASVRPVITYGFFLLLCGIDCALIYHGFTTNVGFQEMADQLWDDETQALFASIIAFHFGGRAFGK